MDVWSVIKADLNIVDMIRRQRVWSAQHDPCGFRVCRCRQGPVAVECDDLPDIGLDIRKVTYFKPAYERGLGRYSEKAIESAANR